ncbi:MAG: hypothetical protein EZS28_038626, partial [Streblomastix strix]
AMAMIVAFCAARMTELVQMKVSEIVQEQHSITLQTQMQKGKQIIKHTITFRKRIGRCCPVKTLLSWTAQREKYSIMHDQIWHNLSKKAPATPQYCSHQLTNITRRAGIKSQYSGPTIRHAMMTRLRAEGATNPEVNAFTSLAISSYVVDVYYNKHIERNQSALLILNEERYKQHMYQRICCECLENGLDMARSLQQPVVSVPCAEGVVELVNLGELSTDEEELEEEQLPL